MESSGLGGAGTDVELFDDVPVAGCDPYAPNAADSVINRAPNKGEKHACNYSPTLSNKSFNVLPACSNFFL